MITVSTSWSRAAATLLLVLALVIAALLAANTSFGLILPILNFGTEEQKRHYLGLAAKGRTLTSVAITEAGTGSDRAGEPPFPCRRDGVAGQARAGRAHSRSQQARNASFQGQVRLIFSTRRVSVTLILARLAISSMVGSRPSSCMRALLILRSLLIVSIM